MRHGKRINHLGRTAPHRKAMLSNMATSLILHKRISTTVAKAKALRKYVEPIITKSKDDTTHSRRTVFSYLQDKESVRILFDDVAEKIATRPGGYTRIIKTGNRIGDNAEMCIIELVDYNELLLKDSEADTKKKTRRRGKKASTAKTESSETVKVSSPKAETKSVEETKDVEEAAPVAEVVEPQAEVEESIEAKADENPADEKIEEKPAEEESKEEDDSEKEK